MLLKLHKNATTMPRTRAYIQASRSSVAELAQELGVNECTVRRWKGRTGTADRTSTPHRLQTRFTPEEEEIAVELRVRLELSLDDVLEVMRRCVRPDVSRAGLHRCLTRRGAMVRASVPSEPETKAFAPQPFGFVHVDLKHLTRLQGRRSFVFVAIERTSRFVFVEIIAERTAAAAAACLERFLQAFAHPVHTVLTDNGSEFTDRFGDARWRKRDKGTGAHLFDQVCRRHGLVHKLTRPYRPQTNGMVERFIAASARPSTPSTTAPPTSARTASRPIPNETPSSSPSFTTTIEPGCDASATKPHPRSSPTFRDTTRRPGPRRFSAPPQDSRVHEPHEKHEL